jgi:hypothetical protein
MQGVEIGVAVHTQDDCLAINDEMPLAVLQSGYNDPGKAFRPVVSAARLTSQEEIPTATKNTAAIQASEPEGLPWMIAIKMIVAAIEHAKAIARLHQ